MAPAVVLLVAVLVSLHVWTGSIHWTPDALYYQAKTLSIRGQDENSTLHAEFRGPHAKDLRAEEQEKIAEDPSTPHKFTSATWIDYTSRFFDRRVMVPLIAAAIYPVFGVRSVLVVSLVGYLLLSLALFAMLRLRFGPLLSAAVAILCILAPPLRHAAFVPGTDSWGVLLETCALLAAVLVFDRGLPWIAAWVAALALLSITRDDSVVPLVAVGCLFLQVRERRSALLLGSGALSIIPAVLIWGNSSVRENLSYVFSNFTPPVEESWSFVANNYPSHAWDLIHLDISWGTTIGWEGPLWYLGLAVILIGVVLLLMRLPGTTRTSGSSPMACSAPRSSSDSSTTSPNSARSWSSSHRSPPPSRSPSRPG